MFKRAGTELEMPVVNIELVLVFKSIFLTIGTQVDTHGLVTLSTAVVMLSYLLISYNF
jgi:hypothetical protein